MRLERWRLEETKVLIGAWAPLYLRRRRGTNDAWVPLHLRGRVRSFGALVDEDWRAVASAVNSYRAITARLTSLRTPTQCKDRVKTLKKKYIKGQAGPFFRLLHAVWAHGVGDRGAGAGGVEGGGYDGAAADAGVAGVDDVAVWGVGHPGAGGVEGGGAAAGYDGAAGADDGAAADDARASAAAVKGFVSGGDASRGSAVEAPDGGVVTKGTAAVGDTGGTGTASVDARGGAFVHEAAAFALVALNSCRTSDGISERVKPLSDIYEKKHDAVGEEGGGVEDASGGASVDERGADAEPARRRATFVPPPIPKRPRSAKPAAAASFANMAADMAADLSAGSSDAAVMTKFADSLTKMAEMYKELRTKALDAEREKAAAAHAGVGRRA